jgi:nitrite reductase/ring-hydroxylating ferredoxin subunit
LTEARAERIRELNVRASEQTQDGHGKGVGMMEGAYVRVASLRDLGDRPCLAVRAAEQAILLVRAGDGLHALDNRCPHMGFPLDQGTLREGILTCHWHHARFDIRTGGTFDLWADDVRAFPVRIAGDEIWVDLSPPGDGRARHLRRVRDGLERNLPLVIAKAVIPLVEAGGAPREVLRVGLEFGSRFRRDGWAMGLTILTCLANLLAFLRPEDRPLAMYHGLAAVARDCDRQPARFPVEPLPSAPAEPAVLKRWFRQFVEVRDLEGAERCLVTAARAGLPREAIADLLFAAATDHRYLSTGHALDFTNKVLEALDRIGWDGAEAVLAGLVGNYTFADRMEESSAWRHPVDLVAILEQAFERLPAALAGGRGRAGWTGRAGLVPVLLGDNPATTAEALLAALADGATPAALAQAVALAAAQRIARFHTANEFGDWDTALHTFTFANAVHQGIRRVPSAELLRGVFDAAMSVYLDRFLNVPPARIPDEGGPAADPEALLQALLALLDRQQQVNQAGALVAHTLRAGGDPSRILATLGQACLREDRDFHTIQCLEAAAGQCGSLDELEARATVLIAAARYLAAHAPTPRAQGQTYRTALRLHRGERIYEETET